jgi:hypothetical protein
MHDCLHLKTAVTRVDENTLLINPKWVDTYHFANFKWIEVDPSEPFAANCLPIGSSIIYPTTFPKTCAKLEAAGHNVTTVDVSELAKAEGAVTCCSLITARVKRMKPGYRYAAKKTKNPRTGIFHFCHLCAGEDLNLHALRHMALNHACLPIPAPAPTAFFAITRLTVPSKQGVL